jgi:hypothetical protein
MLLIINTILIVDIVDERSSAVVFGKRNRQQDEAERSGGATDGSLNVLLVICVLAAVLAAGAGFWELARNVTGDRMVDVSINAADLTIAEVGQNFEPVEVAGTVAASARAYLVSSLGRAAEAAAAVMVAAMLGLVLNSARHGDPFVAVNARRLRWAALAAIPGLSGALVASFGAMMATEEAGFLPQATLSFAWVFVFFILAALSEIWKVGVAMREDARLTV